MVDPSTVRGAQCTIVKLTTATTTMPNTMPFSIARSVDDVCCIVSHIANNIPPVHTDQAARDHGMEGAKHRHEEESNHEVHDHSKYHT